MRWPVLTKTLLQRRNECTKEVYYRGVTFFNAALYFKVCNER